MVSKHLLNWMHSHYTDGKTEIEKDGIIGLRQHIGQSCDLNLGVAETIAHAFIPDSKLPRGICRLLAVDPSPAFTVTHTSPLQLPDVSGGRPQRLACRNLLWSASLVPLCSSISLMYLESLLLGWLVIRVTSGYPCSRSCEHLLPSGA